MDSAILAENSKSKFWQNFKILPELGFGNFDAKLIFKQSLSEALGSVCSSSFYALPVSVFLYLFRLVLYHWYGVSVLCTARGIRVLHSA